MQEKKVVFCEGIHDAILISILLDQKDISYDKITHEELLKSGERTPENNKINEFLRSRNRSYKYLIKEEGGYPRCIENFIILYEDKDDRYTMFLVIDAPALTKLKKDTSHRFSKDILVKKSENFYLTKDKLSHRIFCIPVSLEFQVKRMTGKNLDLNNRDELKSTLKEFKHICFEKKIKWFLEFEEILFR